MRRAAKVDTNHAEIVKAFKAMGCSVASTAALGNDFPDILVAFGGITWLVEIKYGKRKETPGQIEFTENWQGSRTLIRDVAGVESTVKTMRAQSFKLQK